MVQWLNPIFEQNASFKEYTLKDLTKEIDEIVENITSDKEY